MRRLTLILSDLYLPEEAAIGGMPRPQRLPALDELLNLAGAAQYIGDWRRWLLQLVGGGELVNLPLATICAYEKVADLDSLNSAWLATPVALEARVDHVRLVDRGLLYLDQAERAACCDEFSQVFGPQLTLHDCGERAIVLTGLAHDPVRVIDPARLLGTEIGPAFPGPEAPDLRRLWAEIEMWLHGSRLNAARARAGKLPVSAFWLWGRDVDPRKPGKLALDVEIFGRDALICGLSREAKVPPESLSRLATHQEHAIAEFAPLTGDGAESLQALDANWFGAARDELASGALSELTLVANDRAFRITARSRWRFWRSRHNWIENLARPAKQSKA